MNRIQSLILCCIVFAFAAGSARAVVVYDENFNSFTNGALAGQNGWINNISDGLDVSGGVVIGDNSDGGSRIADIMSFNSHLASVTIEMDMRGRAASGFQNLAGITDAAGTQFIQFGSNASGYYLRRQDGSTLLNANIAGDDALGATGHAYYDHRITFDFLKGAGLWEASRQLGDGLFSTIATFNFSDIGALIQDPTNWNGLALRATNTADQFDNILITATFIPEPASMTLGAFAMSALALRRRRTA